MQHVNSGIGHIIARAEKLGCSPALVSIGINYGPVAGDVKAASVFVGMPATELPDKPMDIALELCRPTCRWRSERGRRRILGAPVNFG